MTKLIKKTTEIEWTHQGTPIVSSIQMPKDTFGFVYLIKYVDGTKYVGKKNIFSYRSLKAKKDGSSREGTVNKVMRNTGKGFRQAYDIVKKESDWKTYQGSHKECKTRIPTEKVILEYAKTQKQLTYLEAKYLFSLGVLESDIYLNDNILGSFFRSDLE